MLYIFIYVYIGYFISFLVVLLLHRTVHTCQFDGQEQTKPLNKSWQSPPFLQGLLRHSSIVNKFLKFRTWTSIFLSCKQTNKYFKIVLSTFEIWKMTVINTYQLINSNLKSFKNVLYIGDGNLNILQSNNTTDEYKTILSLNSLECILSEATRIDYCMYRFRNLYRPCVC